MATDAKPTYSHHNETRRRPDALQKARHSLWLPTTLLCVGVFLVYFLTRTAYNTFDAVSYASQIGTLFPKTHDRRWLFHPHHLLFNATNYLAWRLARIFGYGGGPLVVMQSLNAAWGAAGVGIFYLTLRRLLQRSRWLPMIVSLGLASSYGWWVCATDGRVNITSAIFLVAAFAALCGLWEKPTAKQAAWVGGLAGAAVLYHESAGLFLCGALVGVALAPASDPLMLAQAARREKTRQILTCGLAWAATVLVPYFCVGVFALGLHSVSAFRTWMTSYAELGWWWNFNVLHNLRLDAYALRHAAFVEPPGGQGTFHLSRDVPTALRALYWATLVGWFAAVYAFFVALPILWRSHHRRLLISCVVWIALYAAFFTVWNPGYFVFWVPVLVPVSVLLALAAAHYRARRGGLAVNWLIGIWIAMFAAVNVVASIGPHLDANSDPFRRAALDVRAHTSPGDLILLTGMGDAAQCEVDITYFANRDTISLHTTLTRARENKDAAQNSIQSQISQTLASGHAVYAFDELWHSVRASDALQKRHALTPAARLAVFRPYARTFAWRGPRGPVWKLTPLLAHD